MNSIATAAEGGSNELHLEGQLPPPAAQQPLQSGANVGHDHNSGIGPIRAVASPQRPEAGEQRQALDSKGLFWQPVLAKDEQVRLIESLAKLEEAKARQEEQKTEREKIKSGVPIPPKPTDLDSIALNWAMPKHVSVLKLEYLVDPFLPARCVVGFFGRGSTSKSSFLATLAARISEDWSTLWISVEEPSEWIAQRHIRAGGDDATLAVYKFEATKKDAQGRVVGSTFNIYQGLEGTILKAKLEAAQIRPERPRPLRLVVLDTAVGLTTWGKGESPNNDADVKRLLAYLQAVAEIYDVTIAVIGHSNKGKHEHFADTVAGSGAWTTSPRLSFVHARDRREEHAFVMRVAKSNLTSSFGVACTTEPVLNLYQHTDDHASVLCKVNIGPIVWGEEESMDLYEAATRKPDDEGDGGGGRRVSLVETVLIKVVELVHRSGAPVTRELVHTQLGREVTRREWRKVDERLRLAAFNYRVAITAGPQNKALYRQLGA